MQPLFRDPFPRRALFPTGSALLVIAALMAAYIAGYAWSAPNTDSADELMRAYEIRHGIAYATQGPFLGGALHLGPAWFYVIAVALWVSNTWLAGTFFVAFVCALKFPLAWHCGRRLLDGDFGVLWAIALFVPGWSTLEELAFMNANVVATVLLAVLALGLRGLRTPPGAAGYGLLGLMLALAIHAHPTSFPIAIVIAAVLWAHRRERRQVVIGLVALAVGFALPFLPYVASQALHGFPDSGTASSYLERQISLAGIASAPSVVANSLWTGPAVMARYFTGWSDAAAQALGAAFAMAVLPSFLAILVSHRARRALAGFLAALAVFGAWIACLRVATPFWFVWVLGPVVGGLIALGLWSIDRAWRLRPLVLAVAAAAFLCNAWMIRGMALTVRDGEGSLPSRIVDIKGGMPPVTYRDVWFPATGHGPLGEALCATRGPVSLHGPLAYLLDKDLALDTLFACADRTRFTMAASAGATHLAGMTRTYWRALSWTPRCRIGSLGMADGVVAPLEQPGIALADGATYLPRRPSGHPAREVPLAFEAPGRDAILVTNVLGNYESFRVLGAAANGRPAAPVASDDVSALYAPAGGDAPVAWTLTVLASEPRAVDVAAFPAPARHGDAPRDCFSPRAPGS